MLFNLEGARRGEGSGNCGPIAQLGERLPCKQEASGSIPLISTTSFLSRKKGSKESFRLGGKNKTLQAWIEVFTQQSEHFNLTLKEVGICTLKTEQ